MGIPSLTAADPGAKPYTPPEAARPSDALNIEANYPFSLWAFPHDDSGWFAGKITEGAPDEIGTWLLPQLHREVHQAGVNGHRTLPAGADAYVAHERPFAKLRAAGGVYLDPAVVGDYRCERTAHPTVGRRGKHHYTVFDRPSEPRPGRLQEMVRDEQAYRRWLLGLVRSGVVPAPSDDILRTIRAAASAPIERVKRDNATAPAELVERLVAAKTSEAAPALEAKIPTATKRKAA